MLKKLNDKIQACHQRAADAAEKAAAISEPSQKAAYAAAEDRWTTLAEVYGSDASQQDSIAPAAKKPNGVLNNGEAETETADQANHARLLQDISTSLIRENDINALYERIVDGAMALMDADFGSMQEFQPERNELLLLAWRGFHPESASFWDRVGLDSVHTTCGVAFNSSQRIIVSDVEDCDYMQGSADLDHYRLSGMRAMQSTPLVSRSGELLGMISTHWRASHHPSENALQLLDVLARQAADLIERTRSEARILLLANEAEHRAKNILATVQAMVKLSHADTADGLKTSIYGRIQALANVHRLFAESRWNGADLHTLAHEELSPFQVEGDGRVQVEGVKVTLKPDVAQVMGIAFHELSTNSVKYGALSTPGGRIHVSWFVETPECLKLQWTETGGPAVTAPSRQGFGTHILTNMISHSLRGDVQFDWRASGLVCKISIPI
jgi:two-component sensor histidine kinase